MHRNPINRHISIQPLSRDHHHSLLVTWKIRTGLRHQVAPMRIYKYACWYYTHYLIPHFMEEETYLFPILGSDHSQVNHALADHSQIHRFFKNKRVTEEELIEFEKLLTSHIRYEERILFNTIQDNASESEIKSMIHNLNDYIFIENSDDEFWL